LRLPDRLGLFEGGFNFISSRNGFSPPLAKTFKLGIQLCAPGAKFGPTGGECGCLVLKVLELNFQCLLLLQLGVKRRTGGFGLRGSLGILSSACRTFAARICQALIFICDLVVDPSQGNFLLVRFASEDAAKSAWAHLRDNGTLIRPVGGYGLADCLRITIGLEDDMHNLVERLVVWQKAQ